MFKLRLIRRSKLVREYGYADYTRVYYQCLQIGFLYFWFDIDKEEIPSHAIIDLGCFGTTEWRSKYSKAFPELF